MSFYIVYVWLISLSITFTRLIHIVANDRTPLLLKVEQYFTIVILL